MIGFLVIISEKRIVDSTVDFWLTGNNSIGLQLNQQKILEILLLQQIYLFILTTIDDRQIFIV